MIRKLVSIFLVWRLRRTEGIARAEFLLEIGVAIGYMKPYIPMVLRISQRLFIEGTVWLFGTVMWQQRCAVRHQTTNHQRMSLKRAIILFKKNCSCYRISKWLSRLGKLRLMSIFELARWQGSRSLYCVQSFHMGLNTPYHGTSHFWDRIIQVSKIRLLEN